MPLAVEEFETSMKYTRDNAKTRLSARVDLISGSDGGGKSGWEIHVCPAVPGAGQSNGDSDEKSDG